MTSTDTLTFLFADLESSTRLWERFPVAMKAALERHDTILRDAVEQSGGRVLKTTGDGLVAVFPSAPAGVHACLEAQLRLQDEPWGETGPLRVRMGMHAGEAQSRGDDYLGPPVYRAARIMAAAHGGQVLLSQLVAEWAEDQLPAQVALRDLGEHRLKDLLRPERIFQLVHPRLPSDFPPLATLGHRPNNLPTQTSEFLGRESELRAVRAVLDDDPVRLLTLTGPGGIGKTRLALQVAAEQAARFKDGLYFVDLSPVRDANLVFEAIVRVLDAPPASGGHPLDVLKEQLRSSHVLLVLDNFEQVMSAADGLAELLQWCPNLKMLVTSREALRVRGEHLFAVPPLSLPPGNVGVTAEAAAAYEAVRLFVDRAREARANFALTDDNAAAVAEICARLDGLPLAIELAAARLKLFTPDELRDRLRSRLQLLRGGPRDLPARQQTLRSTIEWSYELLDEEERAIFRLLSVFSTASVEAVEGVAGRIEPLRDVDVVDRLASLVDKSLVRGLEGDGPQRLSMLETIREYAAERLDEQVEIRDIARRAHAEFFSEYARRNRDRLDGPEREDALEALAAEIGNLRSAWRYWVDVGDVDELDELLDGLWVLHEARGWYSGAVDLAQDLLGMLSVVPATPDRMPQRIALATGLARGLLALRGHTQEVDLAYTHALRMLKEAGDLPQLFPALRNLATYYQSRAEAGKAVTLGKQLLEIAEERDDDALRVDAHLVIGSNLLSMGETRAATEHLDRAIGLFDPNQHSEARFRLGANPGVVAHTTSAFILWVQGDPHLALERGLRALELARRLNHPFTQAYTFFHVGLLHAWRRELDLVYERAGDALRVAEEHDYVVWRTLALVLRGLAMTGLGRPEEGLSQLDHAFIVYQGLATPPIFGPLLLSLRARGFLLAGRAAEGLPDIDEAIAAMGGNIDTLYPEFPLLKGDLLLASAGAKEAEPLFQHAWDTARQTGSRMTELRAATRLARLWRGSARHPDGIAMLREVYATFDEGTETLDLVEARELLEQVGAAQR